MNDREAGSDAGLSPPPGWLWHYIFADLRPCEEYRPAGMDEDGYPDCVRCGYPEEDHCDYDGSPWSGEAPS